MRDLFTQSIDHFQRLSDVLSLLPTSIQLEVKGNNLFLAYFIDDLKSFVKSKMLLFFSRLKKVRE